jgi:nitroreductase
MDKKIAKTSVPISSIIAERWSVRAFDSSKMVARKDIISLCEAARWAPSCYGDEPWRFIVWDKFHKPEDWDRAFQTVGEWNKKWVNLAPVLIAAIADTNFRIGNTNRWAQFDTGAAAQNLYLQAVELGLAAHPLAGFDSNALRREFGIPQSYIIMALIAVGYQTAAEILDEEYLRRETSERYRRPIGVNFFDSSWENPIA